MSQAAVRPIALVLACAVAWNCPAQDAPTTTATVPAAKPAEAEAERWEGSVELPGGMKLEFSVVLANGGGTISIPMQGAKDLPLTDVTTGEAMGFTLALGNANANAVWSFKAAPDGKTAEGTLKQMGQEFKSTLKRLGASESAKAMNRPQEPAPPFPYASEEVTIKVERGGHTLAGTFTKPEGKGPFPAVILVSGSGPQDRDEQLLGHKPFLVLADHLTRAGVAVLRYDDRGVGKSTGDFQAATSDDFADDAQAAITFLAARGEVDAKRVGIVGHSEGGLIAPIVAARSEVPRFIVLLAGPGMPSVDLLALQGRLIAEASGVAPDAAKRNAEQSEKILAMVAAGKPDEEIKQALRGALEAEFAVNPETKDTPEAERASKIDQLTDQQWAAIGSPWMRRFLAMDPREALRKVKVPVLALNGERDLQVPPKENLAGIAAALKEAGNAAVTTLELPGLNHLFQTSKTGAPSEYATIEETFAPAALDAVTAWILKR
jgi:pimeloyl-ACP methyl ester carboxylesterase